MGQNNTANPVKNHPSEAFVIGNGQDQRQVHKAVVGVVVLTTPVMLPEPSNCKHPENKCYIVHALNWCFSTLEESDQQRFAHCGIALASQLTWQTLVSAWAGLQPLLRHTKASKESSEAKQKKS